MLRLGRREVDGREGSPAALLEEVAEVSDTVGGDGIRWPTHFRQYIAARGSVAVAAAKWAEKLRTE